MRNLRRQQVRQTRKRRKLVFFTFGILLFIFLTINMIVGEKGLLRYMELRSLKERMVADTMLIEKQNVDIKDQIETLENENAAIEELAREYGLTKEGELIYKFKDKE